MAIEDAAVLSTLLSHVQKPSEMETAFRVYDELRRPRSQRLVTTSNEAGRLYEFQLPGIHDDPRKCAENVNERLKWVWNFDLDEECQRAIKRLNESI
jgi:salicylate hydroxylase